MSYRIYFKNIRLSVSIGIHDFEKAREQALLLNVDLLVQRVSAGDEIRSVVDYDFVRDTALGLARERRFELQETFCEALLDILYGTGTFDAVVISSGKPDVFSDVDLVGCTVYKAKSPAALQELMSIR
jgi:dihydroneopterin aldolase